MPTAKNAKTKRRVASKATRKPLKLKAAVKMNKATKISSKTATKTTVKTKKSKVKPIPTGYSTVTPYLIVKGASNALKFYKRAFGATEIMRFADPKGKVMHAEIKIGNSLMMLADEFPEMDARGPHSIGGTPITIHLYVENVDALTKKAITAGATVQRPVKDQFYGDRSGSVIDPFGHVWNISTHIENLSSKEIMKRFAEMKCC